MIFSYLKSLRIDNKWKIFSIVKIRLIKIGSDHISMHFLHFFLDQFIHFIYDFLLEGIQNLLLSFILLGDLIPFDVIVDEGD